MRIATIGTGEIVHKILEAVSKTEVIDLSNWNSFKRISKTCNCFCINIFSPKLHLKAAFGRIRYEGKIQNFVLYLAAHRYTK